jgi:hypothetical protein
MDMRSSLFWIYSKTSPQNCFFLFPDIYYNHQLYPFQTWAINKHLSIILYSSCLSSFFKTKLGMRGFILVLLLSWFRPECNYHFNYWK